jgi:hypothetical protein
LKGDEYKNNIIINYKMSLNPNSSESSFASKQPCAKLSLNINAFNGNTTNFNHSPAPKPKSLPTQPTTKPAFGSLGSNLSPRIIRPMM